MTDTDVVHIAVMTGMVCLKLAGPALIVSLIIGVSVSLFQAVFQVNDQSLSMVPKFIGIAMTVILTAAWQLKTLTDFWTELMHMIPGMLR